MRVLITYASAGAGHKRVAEAIFDYLKINRKDLKLELLDVIPQATGFFRFSYGKGYTFLVHYAHWLWAFFFWITESKLTRWFCRKSSGVINYLSCRKFREYLSREKFDFIISTHFLNSELVANLKLKNKIKGKLITVITDFGVHPFWVSRGTDLYVVASAHTKNRLLDMAVENQDIREFGIPVASSFTISQDRERLAKKIGIYANKFTVLVMTGSFGVGPLDKIAESLCNQAQVLVVCAKNKKLFARLQKRNLENVKVLGFIDNMQELMAVADLIITKPGGSSIVELLNMELLPVFIAGIPGQESANVMALAEYGIGATFKNISAIKNYVLDLKNNPQKILQLKQKIRALQKPFACQELARVIR